MRLSPSVAPALALAVALAAVPLVATPALAADPEPGRLTLTAEGVVALSPDMATLTLGVVTEAETASEALTENSARLASVFAVLDSAEIAARDRQTSGLSLQPIWQDQSRSNAEPRRPEIVGYRVSNTLTVRVRDLDGLGGLLDAVVADGANEFRGLVFGVEDPSEAQDEARRRAVAELRRKAELYADGLGVEIAGIISVTEQGGMPMPVMMEARAMSMDARPVPVAAGELEIRAAMAGVFALEDLE